MSFYILFLGTNVFHILISDQEVFFCFVFLILVQVPSLFKSSVYVHDASFQSDFYVLYRNDWMCLKTTSVSPQKCVSFDQNILITSTAVFRFDTRPIGTFSTEVQTSSVSVGMQQLKDVWGINLTIQIINPFFLTCKSKISSIERNYFDIIQNLLTDLERESGTVAEEAPFQQNQANWFYFF